MACQKDDTRINGDESMEVETEDKVIEVPSTSPSPTPSPEPTSQPETIGTSEEVKVVVYKGKRILELWNGSSLIGKYKIGLGFTPVGHKEVEGDGKTPEGSYYVCTRNNKSKYYLSLGVSYPSIEDAKRGLENSLITKEEHDKIINSINSKKMPPWNTKLGGEIMIHGHGSESDWTRGCIAVDNDVMDILWKYCSMGTEITIYP